MIPPIPFEIFSVEIGLLCVAGLVVLADFLLPAGGWPKLGDLCAGGLAVVLGATLLFPPTLGKSFMSMAVWDGLAFYFKVIFLAAAFLVVLMTRERAERLEKHKAEFYLLVLFATMGMTLLASARDFLFLFVSLELLTVSFYIMTAYLRADPRSVEAGLKFLILGSLSSGFFVFGTSFLYGCSGGTSFEAVRRAFEISPLPAGLVFGMVLVLAGLAFKVAAFPFQLWVPDVYEGAPTPVTAFLSVGSKAAGIVILVRVLAEVFLPAQATWQPLLAVASACTILYGNLAAIPQKNIKRLLAYSSIAHVGYLLMGLACANSLGASAVAFYLLAYLFMNLAAFFVVVIVFNAIDSDEIGDYTGLAQRAPILAGTMFIALLSLAGVPPLAGFFGKFYILYAAVQSNLLWLVFVGAINVVISLYYYLLVIKQMFIHDVKDTRPIPLSLPARVALYAAMAALVGIGVFQGPFVALAQAATRLLF